MNMKADALILPIVALRKARKHECVFYVKEKKIQELIQRIDENFQIQNFLDTIGFDF